MRRRPRALADRRLGLLPEPDLRAQRLISLLQEVFETTFSFDLQDLLNRSALVLNDAYNAGPASMAAARRSAVSALGTLGAEEPAAI